MIEWIPTPESSRTTAIAFLRDEEVILARFPDGVEWRYEGCPQVVWEEFSAPQTSQGSFIATQLNNHPNGPFLG